MWCMLEAKNYLIFSKTSILHRLFFCVCVCVQNMGSWWWLLLIELVLFISSEWSQHSTLSRLLIVSFCDKFISSSFLLHKSFNCSNSLLKAWHVHLNHWKIVRQQSTIDQYLLKQTKIDNTQSYYKVFYSFWFRISLIIKHSLIIAYGLTYIIAKA